MGTFRNSRVVVIGLARSGVGAANLLARLGAKVAVNDMKGSDALGDALALLDPGIESHLGGHPPELLYSADLLVLSPGVPLTAPFLQTALAQGVPCIGELELSYRVLGEWLGRRPEVLAVTGTNGKSTTTTLLYEMLRRDGIPAFLGGNIGTALTEVLCGVMAERGTAGLSGLRDVVVAELSSFQLETTQRFRPRGAAILNITDDHLDRYPSMDAYVDAKARVFASQAEGDFLVLNADDPLTAGMGQRFAREAEGRGNGPEVFFFSRRKEVVKGAFLDSGLIRFKLPGGTFLRPHRESSGAAAAVTLDPASFVIRGVHNIENAMAAALMALLSGCRGDAVAETLRTFGGLEHRLEFVREVRGVSYFNDSKGTNTGAVLKSLEGFSAPVVLIAGGRDKHSDFTVLRPVIKEKVRSLVLIGEAAGAIRGAVGDLLPVYEADDLEGAVKRASELALPGDVVLLSPACASFDMFVDFEDRGRRFKQHVTAL